MPPTTCDAKGPAAKPRLQPAGSDRRDAGAVAADGASERRLKLPYHIVLVRDADGDDERRWTARVQELPGCEVSERTSEEAARAISHAMEEWLDAALERGADIPEPRHPSTHSGRLL